jgi:hypothetical protein
MATPPDFTTGQVLTAAQMNAVGMWLVGTFTVSAQSEIICSSVFSSDYDNYKIVYTLPTNTNFIRMQLRDGSGNVATNYGTTNAGITDNSTSVSFLNSNASTWNDTRWLISPNNVSFGTIEIFQPNLAANTFIDHTCSSVSGTNSNKLFGAGRHNANTQATGFRIFPDSGTFTATVRVYGYNQ